MSVFVLDDICFIELANFAVSRHAINGGYQVNNFVGDLNNCKVLHHSVATDYANILQAENLRSYNARYNESSEGDEKLKITISDASKRKVKSPLIIIKLCHCLEYQSCESNDYYKTKAHRLLKLILKAATCALPGYDAAPWGMIE